MLHRAALERLIYIAAALALRHGALHRLHELHPVGRTEYHARAEALRLVRLQLGVAPAHRQHRAGVLVSEAAYRLAGLAPALGRDGAGVDDDRVRALAGGGVLMPVLHQKRLHRLRLVLVDLAAKSGYNVFHRDLLYLRSEVYTYGTLF